MTADQLTPASTASRPLSASIGATHGAVQQALSAAGRESGYPELSHAEFGYKMIARLSGHLAAMRGAVYPRAAGYPGGAQYRSACLQHAREVEWTLRLLERQLSGDVSATRVSAAAVPDRLERQLSSYRSAEGALVSWLEDELADGAADRLARDYRRALTRAPTRPHPRCPRSGLLCRAGLWLSGRWDRLLDTMDSRPGAGRDFLPHLPAPASP